MRFYFVCVRAFVSNYYYYYSGLFHLFQNTRNYCNYLYSPGEQTGRDVNGVREGTRQWNENTERNLIDQSPNDDVVSSKESIHDMTTIRLWTDYARLLLDYIRISIITVIRMLLLSFSVYMRAQFSLNQQLNTNEIGEWMGKQNENRKHAWVVNARALRSQALSIWRRYGVHELDNVQCVNKKFHLTLLLNWR